MTESFDPVWCKSIFYERPLKCVATYGDNYPVFSNLLDGVVDRIKARIESDNQCVVQIIGPPGTGKSSLGLNIIRKLDKNFRMEDVYIYSSQDIARKYQEGVDQPIHWFDEGSVTLNSLNTTSKEGLRFSQLFDTMRFEHNIYIICMPVGKTLNGRIAEHLDMIIECPKKAPLYDFASRGFFDVKVPTRYQSGKIWEDNTGTGIFRAPPPRIRKEYEAIKTRKAQEFKKKFVEELLK